MLVSIVRTEFKPYTILSHFWPEYSVPMAAGLAIFTLHSPGLYLLGDYWALQRLKECSFCVLCSVSGYTVITHSYSVFVFVVHKMVDVKQSCLLKGA